jgi:hypothetical protein
MTFEINDCYRYASAAAGRALSLAVRAAALADEIDALHRDIRPLVMSPYAGRASAAIPPLAG